MWDWSSWLQFPAMLLPVASASVVAALGAWAVYRATTSSERQLNKQREEYRAREARADAKQDGALFALRTDTAPKGAPRDNNQAVAATAAEARAEAKQGGTLFSMRSDTTPKGAPPDNYPAVAATAAPPARVVAALGARAAAAAASLPVAAAAKPDETASRLRETSAKALYSEAGKLVETIPRKMPLGDRQLVEAHLGRDTPELKMGFAGSGVIASHDLPIVETMAVDLISDDSTFKIEALGERVQLVKKDAVPRNLIGAADHGQWQWYVTPLKSGTRMLALRVSAKLRDSQGIEAAHTLVPDRTIEISVTVNRFKWIWPFFKWAGIAIATGIVTGIASGIIRDDTVWPVVRAIIEQLTGFKA